MIQALKKVNVDNTRINVYFQRLPFAEYQFLIAMLIVEIHSSDRIATKLSLNDSQYPIWQLLFPSESLVFNWSLIGQPSHQEHYQVLGH